MNERDGRWRGEADKSNGLRGPRDDWLRAGDFHDVQGQHIAHQQDEYTVAAVTRHFSDRNACSFDSRRTLHMT